MKKIALGMIIASSVAYAGTPAISFQALTPTVFNLKRDETAHVSYLVTNHAKNPHTMVMQPIRGLKEDAVSGSCNTSGNISQGQSCLLSLTITAKLLERNITSAPVVCADGNYNFCYRPSAAELLKITLIDVK